jgi:hypothetical protein
MGHGSWVQSKHSDTEASVAVDDAPLKKVEKKIGHTGTGCKTLSVYYMYKLEIGQISNPPSLMPKVSKSVIRIISSWRLEGN